METVCPVCNGLDEIHKTCPRCGQFLEDGGRLTSFYEPYAPYLDDEITNQANKKLYKEEGKCVHLLYCPACGFDLRESFPVQRR